MKLFGEECLNVCGVVASTKTGGLKFPTICLILLKLTINKYRHENKENDFISTICYVNAFL